MKTAHDGLGFRRGRPGRTVGVGHGYRSVLGRLAVGEYKVTTEEGSEDRLQQCLVNEVKKCPNGDVTGSEQVASRKLPACPVDVFLPRRKQNAEKIGAVPLGAVLHKRKPHILVPSD